MKPARELPLLHKGDVIGEGDGQYVVQRKLGEGQFAEVWEVKQVNRSYEAKYALKLEKRKDRSTVKAEYKALNRLRGHSQVIAVEGCGTHDERFYMLLQLAGETLFEARKNAPNSRMDLTSVKAVGLSTLAAIQQVHEAKWIHRDIKPANFVLNPPNSSTCKGSWVLIDFGLVRRYADDSGNHLPQRPDASFRGSTAYASVHAHKGQDLSRRDDLWSWLYMLAELLDGGLPWRPDKDGAEQVQVDKHWVLQRKEECVQQPHLLCRSVPVPDVLVSISQHVASLGFEDAPDYEFLRQCLQQLPDPQVQLHDRVGQLTPQPQLQQQQASNGGQWDAETSKPAAWPDWADPAALESQHQQQPPQQHVFSDAVLLTPQSPQQEVSPAPGYVSSPSAAAAAAAQQLHPLEPEGEQMAKRRRLSNGLPEQHMPTSPAAAAAAAAATTAAGTEKFGRSCSRQNSGSADPRDGVPVGSLSSLPQARSRSSSIERQHQQQDDVDVDMPASAPEVVVHQRPPGTHNTGVGSTDIAGLLAAFDREAAVESRQATQHAVQQLCLLRPTEAVCAIALTLDKLVHQSEASCRPAVAQILHDLAAYINAGVVVLEQG